MLGVGSELVTYLPDSMDPPDLDVMPMGMATAAIPPLTVPPDSIISRIFIAQWAFFVAGPAVWPAVVLRLFEFEPSHDQA